MNLSRRRFLAQSLSAAAALSTPSWLRAQERNGVAGEELITEATQRAIDRGLAYLKSRQTAEGSFGISGYSRNVAICGLAGMAFMASGSSPNRGPYGENISRCIDYLLANTNESGFIVEPGSTSHGPMYGHGFATLFLAEAYGMDHRDDLRPKLAKAVELIINTQNDEGGWRYQPERRDADISVTISQIMALRSARVAGIHVPRDTVDRCIRYVKECQNSDGGFSYMLGGARASEFPRSAAGVVALYSAGVYEGVEIEKGLEYLMQYLPPTPAINRDRHYFYGQYYAVQAMWHAGGDYWRRWYPAIRDELLIRQSDVDGSWADSICYEYGTAMACLVLQTPNDLLPIFQR